MKYLRYRASLHPTAIRQASRRFSSQIYIYLFAVVIRFVIGRHDKLNSRSSIRLFHLRYRIRQKRKKGKVEKKEITNRYIMSDRKILVW